jgi:hypothetical protein
MTSTGQVFGSVAASVSEAPWSDNTWTTPTNVFADDAATANVTATSYDSPDQTFVLKVSGFDFSSIPDGSTILGVTARVNTFFRAGQGTGSLDLCQLLDTSLAKVGTNQCATPVALSSTTTTIITKGSTSDLWGNALTAAWVKNSNFGIALGILATAANADVDIDYVTLEIEYTPPADLNLAIPFTDFTEQLFSPTLAIPLGQIKDNFNDDSLNTNLWEIFAGTVTETGGRLELDNAPTYAVVHSRNFVDVTEAEILGEWTFYTGTATGSAQAGFKIYRGVGATYGHLQIMRHNVGSIQISKTEDNVSIFAESITYSATDHKWLRIRLTATQVIFEASTDGITWTTPWTNSTSALPTWSLDDGVLIELFAGYFNAGQPDPGITYLDNFNRAPLELSVGFISAGSQLFAPSFVKDLEVGFISSTAQLFAPTLENVSGAQDLNVGFHEQITSIFPMSLSNQSPLDLEISFLGSSAQFFAPSLVNQSALEVTPARIESTVQLFAPNFAVELSIEVSFFQNIPTFFTPTLQNQSALVISPEFISAGSQLFGPSISLQSSITLEIMFVGGTVLFFIPSLTNEGEELFEPTLVGNGTLADRIFAGLIDQGFLTGSIVDREYARLLAKLALIAPQSYSLEDLYSRAGEKNRIKGIGVDQLVPA